jgi:hypothetical protein
MWLRASSHPVVIAVVAISQAARSERFFIAVIRDATFIVLMDN